MKVIDSIPKLGKVNHQMTFDINEILKTALWEDYEIIYEQDHSECKQLSENDFTDNVKKKQKLHNLYL